MGLFDFLKLGSLTNKFAKFRKAARGSSVDTNSPLANEVSFMVEIVRAGTEAQTKQSCPCSGCRVRRLADESPENAHLAVQWNGFMDFLRGKELQKRTPIGYISIGTMDEYTKAAKEFGLDERLLKIIVDTLSSNEQARQAKEIFLQNISNAIIGAISSMRNVEPMGIESLSPVQLEDLLQFTQSKGMLEKGMIPFEGAFFSIEDLLRQKREELPGKLVVILEKYVQPSNPVADQTKKPAK